MKLRSHVRFLCWNGFLMPPRAAPPPPSLILGPSLPKACSFALFPRLVIRTKPQKLTQEGKLNIEVLARL